VGEQASINKEMTSTLLELNMEKAVVHNKEIILKDVHLTF
jgi:hypothetical protein